MVNAFGLAYPSALHAYPTSRAIEMSHMASHLGTQASATYDAQNRVTLRKSRNDLPSRRRTAAALSLALASLSLDIRCPVVIDVQALAMVELSAEQNLIVEAWAVVQRGYVDQNFGGLDWKSIKAEYLKRQYKSMGAARAGVSEMLGRLGDKYTRYLSPGAYAALLAKYEQPADYGGIGVTLRNVPVVGRAGSVEIVSVVKGGPAATSGMRVGDVIESVDNIAVSDSTSADDVAGLLLGRLDEELNVRVRRTDGTNNELRMKRTVIKAGEAEALSALSEEGGRVGVLKLRSFSASVGGQGTIESMKALLEEEPLASADKLIIDLRGNLGGHFPSGVEAAKLFLPADVTVVYTVDRTGAPSPIVTFEAGKYVNMRRPIYLLVDRGTASAAEVFAAALQANRAALVVGEQTFGKGLVQSIQKLTDNSAVVLTVAKYRTPKGNDINGKGVKPDLPVLCSADTSPLVCLELAFSANSDTYHIRA
mmetsp:Transcript_48046/g.79584  ORF Transcript_48046/g.79584 Transcript_48046/m.79584 type:complete len:480 (+) Transcript_48046:44-1483(+)|eukprot:CAMPEP_0119331574 /NCGR_PEP_ID=MMETSP1333-20130426/80851_1 /TAXON_ID=418940 /ORGANISM="Scyphosphaera apsteinii, Strain RCC1455" /LENGTH=479 /DNA_ID=CAMNT_0007341209 /DNA_START=41 /DNA_END=1480 /DNA_ORIENTATION=+